MNTSQTIGAIAKAIAGAQAELKNPAKDKVATIPTKNGGPGFKYSYADFATALDGIRPVLSKHKIAFIQATEWANGLVMLQTRLMHESGEWIESTYPVGSLADHRTMGSALSYARRYALLSLIGVQGEEDDDGEADQIIHRNQPRPAPIAHDVETVAETYLKRMNAAENLAAFEEEVKKARAAAGRMTEAEKKHLSNVIEARRAFLSQAPVSAAE